MIFERSKQGQENRAIFLQVDYICYVEGGGGISEFSEDTSFWRKVFRYFRSELRIKCLARGGKAEIEALARQVLEDNTSNILVAMDVDYDELLNEKIIDRRILYTYGYSWENDVFSIDNLLAVMVELGKFDLITDEIEVKLRDSHHHICRELTWPARADFIAFCAGASVLPRDAPGRVVNANKEEMRPKINRVQVVALCRQANASTKARNLQNIPLLSDVSRYCVGHVYAFTMLNLIRGAYQHFVGSHAPTKDHIKDVAMLLFSETLESVKGDIFDHYRAMCAEI